MTVSFENYKTSHPVYENEEEEEDDEDFIPQKTKWGKMLRHIKGIQIFHQRSCRKIKYYWNIFAFL